MHHSDYVPLHLHSEYSLLDGAIKIDELVEAAAGMKMPAVAVTDHGNLFGAVHFYRKAVRAGIKPILGCEVYVAPGNRADRHKTDANEAAFHLILLARDNDGYRNLVSLVSRAYTEGFYYKPRIDRQLLEQYSGGLIATSACMQGEVPYYLKRGEIDRARDAALFYKHVLGPENFFLELQENGLSEQYELNRKLVGLSRELHISLVATNDCHYLRRNDALAHEVLLCIQTGRTMSDPGRMRFEGDGFYFRTPEEMKAAFSEVPDAVLNTRAIAERCNVEFRLGETLLPRYETPDGSRPREHLEALAMRGLKKRLGESPPPAYTDRFRRELDVINNMGYPSYFLIVWDFINHAKQNSIPVGPGRGSAAGSLVAYALGITEIDPIRYGLLFERFLNPDRVSLPDIDVDFCKDRRADVINYVSEKYGRDHVAQIITFGTMAARAAIRDVARAMDYPYAEADRLAKLVPDTLKITIKDALRLEPRLKEAYDTDETVRKLLDIAMRLEGLARHASTHAAGVVISPEPLTNYTPLYKSPVDDALTTQFDMASVDSIGLIKFDFLGLKTLTIIEKTIEYLKKGGVEFSLEDIPMDDGKTYEFLGTGATTGVFQLESDGMRDILVKMQPGRFEDLIALVALYRPGPIKSGMIDDFIKRKKGQKEINYELPELKEILDETYGVILYQEQVMSIANRLASFTMAQADVLRKAMGKKKADVMEKQKEDFIKGAVRNGIGQKKAARLFDLMAFFAEYGFNKSHSAAYAYISYQTAYLKAHYPVHFMAATLSMDLDNTDKIVRSIKECRNMSIEILPPDINLCGREFTVDEMSIRFGLGAVKGAGTAAVDAVMAAREDGGPFVSLEDYRRRVSATGKVNKKVNESLVKAGALDSLGDADGSMSSLGRWRAGAVKRLGNGGGEPSLNLFGPPDDASAPASNSLSMSMAPPDKSDDSWDEAELLKHEKDALGFYITGNPLRKYSGMLKLMNVRGLSSLTRDGEEAETAGIVMGIRKIRTRKGDIMASVLIEDEEGSAEVVVFPDLYRAHGPLLEKDTALFVKGTAEVSEKGLKIVARELSGLDGLLKGNGNNRRAVISIPEGGADLKALKRVIEGSSGPMPLYLNIRAGSTETLIQTSLGIEPHRALIDSVEGFFGKGTLKVI
jgi:DNA polymerase-3 subunit alpha